MRLALALGVFILSALPGRSDPVTVFAAASLKPALDAVFEETDTVAVYGGSSLLARQIEFGAPADIFISANTDWMDHLEALGAIDPASRRDIASNRLVLVGPDGTVPIQPQGLAILAGERIATALTDAVPAGLYARAALTALGVWDVLRPSLVETQDVRAALRLAETGAVPYAIVYASDAAGAPQLSVLLTFPEGSHPAILYPAALTARAGPHAPAVLDRIAASRDAFAGAGFLPPGAE